MNKYLRLLFYTGFTVCTVLIGCLAASHVSMYASYDIWYYFKGPSADAFSPVEMMWWLLLFSPVWAACGWLLDTNSRVAVLALNRYKRMGIWWQKYTGEPFVLNFWYFACLMLTVKLVVGPALDMAVLLKVWVVMSVHSLAVLATMVWIILAFKKVTVAFLAALLMEVLSVVFISSGISPGCMPLSWGMYGYCSDIYGTGGFSLHSVPGLTCIYVLTVMVVPQIKRPLILRSVKFGE